MEITNTVYDFIDNGSFNGAITFSLWKFGKAKLICLVSSCFNGAITFSLWKYAMQNVETKTIQVLQWGHNFFVMEIFDKGISKFY